MCLSKIQQQIIAEYMEQIQVVSFKEQQKAYCQEIIDFVQILNGLGLLAVDRKIIEALQKLNRKIAPFQRM